MRKSVAIGIAGVAAIVVAAWRQIQRDNTLARDTEPSGNSSAGSAPEPAPASAVEPDPGQSLFTPSVDENSTRAELYEVATELKIEGRSKMKKSELLSAIRAAG